jgi:hypothetical protein
MLKNRKVNLVQAIETASDKQEAVLAVGDEYVAEREGIKHLK